MIANDLSAPALTDVQKDVPARPEDHLDRGVALTREGRFDEAEACFREAIQLRPDFPEAHNNLGNTLARRKSYVDAIASFREAVRLRPEYAKAHHNLGNALRDVGKIDEAEAAYREAIRLRPDWAEVHNDLGQVLTGRGKLKEAEDALNTALMCRPAYPDAANNLGIAQAQGCRYEAAEVSFRHAIRLRPAFPEAHNNLGNALGSRGKREEAVAAYREAIRLLPGYAKAHHNLGRALAALDRHAEAEASHRESLRLRPGDASVVNDLGIALAGLGRLEEAEQSYRESIRLRPNYAEAHNNLGNVLRELRRVEESLPCFEEALRVRPNYAEAINNRAISLSCLGRLDEATACYTKSLALQPENPYTHLNRALSWLRAGRFELGWPEYEWRWRRRETPPPKFIQPPWNGAPLGGRTILVYTEQGNGDTLQFIRYAPMVQARGGRVVVQCPDGLAKLLARCPGIDRLVPRAEPLPDFDVQVALMSLPSLFHTTLATVPSEVPYLFADEELVGDWRRRLADVSGFRIGVVWQGNPKFGNDRARSFPLKALAPLAELEGVSLVSLQVENGLDQLKDVPFPVLNLGSDLVRAPGMFMDAAAVARNLDLVIACDSAVAHLAGGLGVPVWLGLPYSCDWRWMDRRPDSPWYPTMRIFRQPAPGDWDTVFGRMAGELSERLDAERAPRRRTGAPRRPRRVPRG